MPGCNRNPVKNYLITFPHSSESSTHADNMSRSEFGGLIASYYPYELVFVVQESHACGAKHLHAILRLTVGIPKKKLLDKILNDCPGRVNVTAIKSPPSAYRYLTEVGYSPSSGKPPKCVTDIDQEPYVLGSLDSCLPRAVFAECDWHALCSKIDPAGVMLERDWSLARTDPFNQSFLH